jgi:hypothetical protein
VCGKALSPLGIDTTASVAVKKSVWPRPRERNRTFDSVCPRLGSNRSGTAGPSWRSGDVEAIVARTGAWAWDESTGRGVIGSLDAWTGGTRRAAGWTTSSPRMRRNVDLDERFMNVTSTPD